MRLCENACDRSIAAFRADLKAILKVMKEPQRGCSR
jgi:hypothetical protein